MRLLLVGAGNWGQKYISTLSKYSNIKLEIANRNNWKQLIDSRPDGVMICTPPSSHIEIAEFALERNIPTMIEKPLSLSLEEAHKLKKYEHIPILVNHIHLFSETYNLLKYKADAIDRIVSLGFNNGPIRDYSSLWDYGPHDISMIMDLMEPMDWLPDQVNATQIETKNGFLFDIKMKFKNIETESLVGNGGVHPVRKLKIESGGLQIIYDGKAIQKDRFSPLENALQVFMGAIHGTDDRRLGLDLSFRVLNVLESCDKSLRLHH